jgi:hypothetical protein
VPIAVPVVVPTAWQQPAVAAATAYTATDGSLVPQIQVPLAVPVAEPVLSAGTSAATTGAFARQVAAVAGYAAASVDVHYAPLGHLQQQQ